MHHRVRVIVTIIGAVAVLLVVLVLVSSSGPSRPIAPASPRPSAWPGSGNYNALIGSSLTVTDYNAGTQSVVTVNSIAMYQLGQPHPAGIHFVIISVTYHAIKGTASTNALDWETKDASGLIRNSVIAPGELHVTMLQPGQTVSGNVVLPVSNTSTSNTIVYSSGLAEAGSWTIPGDAG